MPAGIGAAIGIGAGVSAIGGLIGAGGARSAADAAHGAAVDWSNQIDQSKAQALQAYGAYSPTQQAALDKSIAAQTQDLARQQKLVDSINPALLSAGEQMKQILDGKSAPVLKNLNDQRQLQRQNVLDSLRQQLGPGAETSSLGQKTLQQFDAQTANIMSGAQQSYLNEVSGLALNGNATLGDSIGRATSNLAKLGDQYGQIGLNQANIISGFQAQQAGPQQQLINTAGAAGQQQQQQGQMLGNLGSSIIQGAAFSSMMKGAGGGGSGPSTLGQTASNELQPVEFGASSPWANPGQSNYSLGADFSGGGSSLASSAARPAGGAGTYGWTPQAQTYLRQ